MQSSLSSFVRLPQMSLIALTLFSGISAGQDPAKKVVVEIVSNIQSNEGLYDNLDVQIKYGYLLDPASKEDDDMVIKKRDLFLRSVRQGVFFFADFRQEDLGVKGNSSSYKAITAFDGETTRSLMPLAQTANIHHERSEPPQLYRPHNWIFPLSEGVMVPLSTYLRGGDQFRTHPSAGLYKHCDINTSFEKAEEVNDVACLKLRCDIWKFAEGKKGVLGMYFFLWVAPERNYLPVKLESFEQKDGKLLAVPSALAIAENFRQIKPGLWLPNRQKLIIYDDWESKPGKMVINNTTTIDLEKVEVDVKYPIGFFRDISFPKGTEVIETKPGEANKVYVIGQSGKDQGDGSAGNRWLPLVVGSSLFFVCLGAALLYRRWKSRRLQGK